jgi:hypothetical protein
MIMKDKQGQNLWTIRQASDKFFHGFDSKIPVTTIQTWIRRGIFIPKEQAMPRDPRGSRLDISDLVTLLLLRSFSCCGVGWESLLPEKLSFADGLMAKDELKQLQYSKNAGRPVQWYLDRFDCQVHSVVSPGLLWKGHRVNFHPTEMLDESWWLRMRDGVNQSPTCIISASAQYRLILETIG